MRYPRNANLRCGPPGLFCLKMDNNFPLAQVPSEFLIPSKEPAAALLAILITAPKVPVSLTTQPGHTIREFFG